MKSNNFWTAFALTAILTAGGANTANAVCSTSYCVQLGDFSTVGGDLSGTTGKLLASNMYPYPQRDTWVETYYPQAVSYLEEGKTFYNGLSLINADPTKPTPQGKMIANPALNYQSVGLLANLPTTESHLLTARDTFAIAVYRQYPDLATAKAKLLDSVKTLAYIYLMIGDEYLIDALEWRFSSPTLGVDQKLDEQIALLESARTYYEKALAAFISGFSPAVGTNLYISDHFDDAVFDLFRLAVERMSLALREKSSKVLVRRMAPDPMQEWTDAQAASLATLKSANTTAYLTAAAISQKQGAAFDAMGGDANLTTALATLRKQGHIANQGLNPLGYDNRYVLMTDFSTLYNLADSTLKNAALVAESNFKDEKRLFDANQEALTAQINAINSQYVDRLSTVTGCPMPSNLSDPVQIDNFVLCTGEAGGNLFDCRLELSGAEFETCLTTSLAASGTGAGGVLAQKYRSILAAHTGLAAALLHRDNIFKRIELENEKTGKLVELWLQRTEIKIAKLDEYYSKLKKARTITDTVTITSTRKRENGKWKKVEKKRDHSTVTSYKIKDDSLGIDEQNEKELLSITLDFDIKQTNLESAYVVKDLLLQAAESEIAIQSAVQQKNSAVADFDNALAEKDNLWVLYQRAKEQLAYHANRAGTLRVLASQSAIELANAIKTTANQAYFAAKALEYQYAEPLSDIGTTAGQLDITDIFKAQTTIDLRNFLDKLNDRAVTSCLWGAVSWKTVRLSLAKHIWGLRDRYIDPEANDTADAIAAERRKLFQTRLQQYIGDNGNLKIPFAIPIDASYLDGVTSTWANIKIWDGQAPSGCDPFPSSLLGTAVRLQISQPTTTLQPMVRLAQAGHSTFRNQIGDLLDFVPINNYQFLLSPTTAIPPQEKRWAGVWEEDPLTKSSEFWTRAFKGRSLVSQSWELEVDGLAENTEFEYEKIDFSKLGDIVLYFSVIGQ